MKQFIHYLRKHFRQPGKKCLCLIMLCTFCCTAFLGCSESDKEAIVILSDDSEDTFPYESEIPDSQADAESTPTENPMFSLNTGDISEQDSGAEEIYVYVCGHVENPDVYCLPPGSRICDAIEAAGGLLEDASEDYWNLAEILSDGDMIYIPSRAEAEEREMGNASAREQSLATAAGQPQTSASDPGKTGEPGLVNINLAGSDQLMTLPGIGQARAASIIAYREAHGSFLDSADLKNVSGIGNALYDKIKSMITVQ